MHPHPRRILRQLLSDHGPALLDNPSRVDAFLADLCGQHHRERFLLIHALRERVAVARWPVIYWLTSCSQRLQSQYCFSAEAARWAADSWSLALNITPPDSDSLDDDGVFQSGSEVEFSESPQPILRRLFKDHGPALLNAPARVDALLADLCTKYPRERFLLVHALRERIPADLLSKSNSGAGHGQRLSQRLQERLSFTVEAADWAVESWSMALNGEALSIPRSRVVVEGNAASDRDALVALYHATAGSQWQNSENWLSGEPLGTWHGVSADDSGRVTDLLLEKNKLSGPIPTELGNLANLPSLDLSGNRLTGSIPTEIEQLVNLTHLDLSLNRLSGSIPAELGNLSNLRHLSLEKNELTGSIPAELGRLSNLKTLHLGDSTYFPGNQISGPIPPQIGRLSNLTSLDFSTNLLSGTVPTALGDLSKLETLDLSENQLGGPIPPQLSNLSSLRELKLERNQLSGPIPAEFANLSNLDLLALSDNQLSGPIPQELAKLHKLSRLFLSNNQFSGPIPSQLANLSKLEALDLSSNQLIGPISGKLKALPRLRKLVLDGKNETSGSVPPYCGSLAGQKEGDERPAPSSPTPSKNGSSPRPKDWATLASVGLIVFGIGLFFSRPGLGGCLFGLGLLLLVLLPMALPSRK